MRGYVALLLALFVAWPLLPAPAVGIQPGGMYGGTVTVAVLDDIDTNPLTAGPADLEALGLAYDSLAKRSAVDQNPVPWLATNWSISGNAATFYLRATAAWASDGAVVSPGDVVTSFQRYNLAGVTASAGTGTVTLTFTANAGRFFGEWIYLPIAWRSGQASPDTQGNGPYAIQDRIVGDHLTLRANANHWNGRPFLDAVIYKVYTDLDAAACAMLLDRGAVDLIGFHLVPDDLYTLRTCGFPVGTEQNRSLINPIQNKTQPWTSLAQNPGLTHLYLGMNTSRAPLDAPELRRGIVQTLDKDLAAISEPTAYVEIADSLVVPGNFYWFNASVPRYRVDKVIVGPRAESDFDRVNNELDLAGFLDRNSDGYREDRNGSPFSFTLLTPSVSADPRKYSFAKQISTNLGKIGINVTLVPESWANITSRVNANNFDLYFGLATVSKDPDFYYRLFHSSGIAAGTNLVNLNEAAADAAVAATRNEIDQAMRQQLAKDMQGWVAENVPWAPILHYKDIDVYDKTAYTGWVNSVGGVNNFWTFVGLHVFQLGSLKVSLSFSRTRLESGTTAQVVIAVVDQDDLAVAGADVELTGGAFAPANGTTNSNGRFESEFTAPATTTLTDVEVTAAAATPGYASASATMAVTVTPVRKQLLVTFEKPKPQIASGETITLNVSVRDAAPPRVAVAGASVQLSLSPANFGGELSATSGTTGATGKFSFTFTGDVSVLTSFLITAHVSAAGFEAPANPTTTSIIVERHGGDFAQSTPGLDTVSLVVVVAALALAYARLQRRRKRDKP